MNLPGHCRDGTQLYRVMENGDYPVPTNADRKLVIPVGVVGEDYVPASHLQGAVDALDFAIRTVTDPDLSEAEVRVQIGAVLGRTLAQIGEQ